MKLLSVKMGPVHSVAPPPEFTRRHHHQHAEAWQARVLGRSDGELVIERGARQNRRLQFTAHDVGTKTEGQLIG